jgi:hypothetical protein
VQWVGVLVPAHWCCQHRQTPHQLAHTTTLSLALAVSRVAGALHCACGCSLCAIKKATPEGLVTTIAGQRDSCYYSDGPGTFAVFGLNLDLGTPSVCVDSTERNLYVADP